MKRRDAWSSFKREISSGEREWVPRKLDRVMKVIESDPSVSMVKCAGILEIDAVRLNRMIVSLMRSRKVQSSNSAASILTPGQGTS